MLPVCRKCGAESRHTPFRISYHSATGSACFGTCKSLPGPSGEHLSIICPICGFMWKERCLDDKDYNDLREVFQ